MFGLIFRRIYIHVYIDSFFRRMLCWNSSSSNKMLLFKGYYKLSFIYKEHIHAPSICFVPHKQRPHLMVLRNEETGMRV